MAQHSDTFVETYSNRVRVIFILVSLALASTFYAFPRFARGESEPRAKIIETVEVINIPPTEQTITPPPPPRPSIPIESDDEDMPEDITIEETGLDDFDWESPPPPPDDTPRITFIAYDVPPVPVGGWGTLLDLVEYPRMAVSAGIEGTVRIQAFINKQGRVTDYVILSGYPETGLDEAAITAIQRTRWKPAMQRDHIVGVWIAIPIEFKL